ncbi:MAG: cytochrome c biogenesis protein CcsA [Chloroflexi bacterium]|nr:cytochrome c biogenesis protein CcsA [Chloroflexota bacterium]
MVKMESFFFMAALLSTGLSVLFYLWQVAALRWHRAVLVAGAASDAASTVPAAGYRPWGSGRFAAMMAVNGLLFLSLSIIGRGVATGHGPFSNMYEFSVALAWGVIAATLYFQWHYRTAAVSAVAMPVALAFLVYAYTLPSRPLPLVPALQQSLLLTLHVAVAMIAYGVFAIGFGSAVLYLAQRRGSIPWLPSPAVLDDMGYRSVIIGFPFMTLVLLLGALWADVAWGRYWSWDPKETSTLVTWLLYGGYVHARVLRGWRGSRSAVLLILGFAAVVFTYMGNYFFSGLHAYK